MERLGLLDAGFLLAEDGDRHISMAIASVAVFEGPSPGYHEFAEAIRGRLPLVPRYRQKLRTVPFDLDRPRWVDDPRFDLHWHIRHLALPSPGDDEQLRRLIGLVMSLPMDRDHPLWEYWLVDGLAGGHWALISKLHHSIVDGVAGTSLYEVVFDTTPQPRPAAPDHWRPAAEPGTLRLTLDAVRSLLLDPLGQARTAAGALTRPVDTGRWLLGTTRGLARYTRSMVPADRSSVSGSIGRYRRFTWAGTTRDDIGTIRRALGGTLNDVVLTAVTGGLRALLLERGEQPGAHALRSLVPVSVRAPGEEGIYGNRVSSMLADLPVHLADPAERLAAVRAHLEELKASREADAGNGLIEVAGEQPYPVMATPVRLAFAHPQRIVTTVTTNVPGPRVPLYGLGRRVAAIIPYVPIAAPARIGISIFSYCDAVTFGLTGDYDTTPDLQVLADGIEDTVGQLVKLAEKPVRPGPAARAGRARRPRPS